MSKKLKPGPRHSEAGARVRDTREAREAAALRANLRRRKVQARGRDENPPADPKP